jgi:hypothetical protein
MEIHDTGNLEPFLNSFERKLEGVPDSRIGMIMGDFFGLSTGRVKEKKVGEMVGRWIIVVDVYLGAGGQ